MKRCADEDCRKLLPLSAFYKYEGGRPHAICIECTKKRRKTNYRNRPKQAGMSKADIAAYLKAHPVQKEKIRKRYRLHYAD